MTQPEQTPAPIDRTLHVEAILIAGGATFTLAFDRITGRGAVFHEGAVTLIDKHSFIEPFRIDEQTFSALNAVYLRESHRELRPPDTVVASRAFVEVEKHVADLVRHTRGNNG